MTRPEAHVVLRRLCHELAPDVVGCARLLERISQAADPELLRDVLIELGARACMQAEPARDVKPLHWYGPPDPRDLLTELGARALLREARS